MMRVRILLNGLAVLLFVAALAYWGFGNLAHEVIGSAFFVLVIAHNVFNRRWYGGLPRRGQDAARLFSTATIVGMALAMMTLLGTGILISKDLFSALAVDGAFAVRAAHMFVAFWALLFLGLHLGTRWTLVMTVARQLAGIAGARLLWLWGLRAVAAAVAVKGAFAMAEMGFGTRLRFQYALDMWDFNADMAGFFVNYLCILGLLAALSHYGLRLWRALPRRGAAERVQ